jgi:hypothetical protein
MTVEPCGAATMLTRRLEGRSLTVAANPADAQAILPALPGVQLMGEARSEGGMLWLPPRSVAVFYREDSHG